MSKIDYRMLAEQPAPRASLASSVIPFEDSAVPVHACSSQFPRTYTRLRWAFPCVTEEKVEVVAGNRAQEIAARRGSADNAT